MAPWVTERPTPDRAHWWPNRAPLPDQESGAPMAVSGWALLLVLTVFGVAAELADCIIGQLW
jgi:hypothetical protein